MTPSPSTVLPALSFQQRPIAASEVATDGHEQSWTRTIPTRVSTTPNTGTSRDEPQNSRETVTSPPTLSSLLTSHRRRGGHCSLWYTWQAILTDVPNLHHRRGSMCRNISLSLSCGSSGYKCHYVNQSFGKQLNTFSMCATAMRSPPSLRSSHWHSPLLTPLSWLFSFTFLLDPITS